MLLTDLVEAGIRRLSVVVRGRSESVLLTVAHLVEIVRVAALCLERRRQAVRSRPQTRVVRLLLLLLRLVLILGHLFGLSLLLRGAVVLVASDKCVQVRQIYFPAHEIVDLRRRVLDRLHLRLPRLA